MPDVADFDGLPLAALAEFNLHFTAFTDMTDPLLAIVEAAHLKGRLYVLIELDVFDTQAAGETRQLIDLCLASIIDTFTTSHTLSLPIEDLLPRLQDHIRTL